MPSFVGISPVHCKRNVQTRFAPLWLRMWLSTRKKSHIKRA